MERDSEYFEYLRKRTLLGLFYRKFILYPRIKTLFHGRVLDVGCGVGDFIRHRQNTVGVDVNLCNVSYCNSHNLDARLMPYDELPFGDSLFDGVMLDNVLEHISSPKILLFEIARVLKPKGILVIGVPGLKGQAADLDHKTYYNEPALETLAKKSGFMVNKYMYSPLFRSAFLSRTLTQYCIYTQWQKID